MSNFDPRYHRSPKNPPNAEVVDFQPEHFTRLERTDPPPDPEEDFGKDAQPKPPAPDPFEEFHDERKKPLTDLMAGLPSLDGLFKPFDLTSENPVQEEFEQLYEAPPAVAYVFEDMDTRNPDVVRTLEEAEAVYHQKILEAEENASRITEEAATEARGRVTEAEAEAQAILERAQKEAEEAAADIRDAAASDRNAAEADRSAAAADRTEAEARLAAVADRIAGLDDEWKALEEETVSRKQALADEEAKVRAELAEEKDRILVEARESGHQEGLLKGLEEGRNAGRAEAAKVFQDQVEGLVAVMSRMENIYNDLWAANGPMMIKLAIEAAEQILNKELRDADDLAARAFEACVDFLSQANRVTFLARPQDIAQLEQAKADQRARLGALVNVTFKPDETLGPGDLIVESDVGRLDATIKHRTEQVMRVLREAFDGSCRPLEKDEPPPMAAAEPDDYSPEPAEELPEIPAATSDEASVPEVVEGQPLNTTNITQETNK